MSKDVEEKDYVKEDRKRTISKVINIVLWLLLFAWMAFVFTDYLKVKNNKEPKFCWFNKQTTKYEDGQVTSCMGLGYKVIKYDRKSFNAIEFGPFWIEDSSEKTK